MCECAWWKGRWDFDRNQSEWELPWRLLCLKAASPRPDVYSTVTSYHSFYNSNSHWHTVFCCWFFFLAQKNSIEHTMWKYTARRHINWFQHYPSLKYNLKKIWGQNLPSIISCLFIVAGLKWMKVLLSSWTLPCVSSKPTDLNTVHPLFEKMASSNVSRVNSAW